MAGAGRMPRAASIDSLSRRPDGTRNDVELRRDEEVRLPVGNEDGLLRVAREESDLAWPWAARERGVRRGNGAS